jgi:putative ABC transport system permease protein
VIAPRWRKAIADVGSHPVRAGLAIVAMAAGTFAFGMVLESRAVLERELAGTFEATRPSAATLWLDRTSDALVDSVRAVAGVVDAESRGLVMTRLRTGGGTVPLALFVVHDFADLRLDRFTHSAGAWPPPPDGFLIERSSLGLAGAPVGGSVDVVEAGALRVAGSVHAPGLPPGWMDHVVTGFVTESTTAGPVMPAIRIRAGGDRAAVRAVARSVAARLEAGGHVVRRVDVPEPGRHPHAAQMDTFLFALGAFGLLALVLSAILVANMVHALLLEQVREVGIMLTLGGSPRQVAELYLAQVAALAVVALAIGIPLASAGAHAYVDFAAGMLNATVRSHAAPLWVYAIEVVVGLGLPLLVATGPVRRAARVPIREALHGDTIAPVPPRVLGFLPRPWSLPLRNALRRRGRLALTVGTLAVAGATFVSALDVAAAWEQAIARDAAARGDDLEVLLAEPTDASRIALAGVPGVVRAEPWGGVGAESGDVRVSLLAPPDTGRMFAPRLLAGRWLAAGDSAVVVITQALQRADPSLRVGGTLPLRVKGREFEPRIVGVARELMPNPTAYAPERLVRGFEGGARTVRVALREHDAKAQMEGAAAVERALASTGVAVSEVARLGDRRKAFADHLLIIDAALLLAAALVLLVGTIGLASTLGMGVLERTREFGVLGALGAGPRTIASGVLAEGAAMALAGWALALVLAVPLSAALDAATGSMFLGAPIELVLSPFAAGAWLAVALVISLVAGAYPAWRAARGNIREALAHE